MARTTLRTTFGTGLAVVALAAVLAGCDGSAYSDGGFDDSGFSEGLSESDTGSGSDSDEGSVIFGSDGDSLTTLPDGGFSFSGSDGSSFSSGG